MHRADPAFAAPSRQPGGVVVAVPEGADEPALQRPRASGAARARQRAPPSRRDPHRRAREPVCRPSLLGDGARHSAPDGHHGHRACEKARREQMNNRVGFAPLLFLFGARIAAQSFVELTDGRNTTNPFSSVFTVEAGAIGVAASPDATTRGLDDEISWDGRAYFRDEAFGSRRGTLEAYAGRDGIFAGYTDGKLVGDATMTRFEVRAQPWQFYRDGFYDDDELRVNGFYDGSSYEGYVGFGRDQQGLYIEFGPFYKTFDFKESRLTPATFTIPEDYNAYGGRVYLEQNTVQMDRRRGMPRDGYALTIIGEREWNDSQGEFGTQSIFETKLPSAVWRVRGRLEWYIPASDSAIW